jgi:hypothetical protein
MTLRKLYIGQYLEANKTKLKISGVSLQLRRKDMNEGSFWL